jgi:predicted transcriptional regulator
MTQGSFFDDDFPPYPKGCPTSLEAAASVMESAHNMRERVYAFIKEHSGAFCDETEVALGLRHQTCSARFWELEHKGRIKKTDRTGRTRSGRNATIYVVV